MVHADHANFGSGLSKEDSYDQALAALEALLVDNWVANLANAASLLWHHFKAQPSPQANVNWCGFYTINPTNSEELVLAPFQGKVACQTIRIGRGVCGAAAASKQTQLVPDVHAHPDHIACDSETNSEIVVPIVLDGQVLGVLDIDCTDTEGFDATDSEWLGRAAALLAPSLGVAQKK